MPLKPGVRCATKTKNDGGKYTICWGEKKKPVKTTPKKTIKVSTKPVKAPKKSVTKKEPIITKPPIRRLETGALMVGKTLKAAPKPAPKKTPKPAPKPAPKKVEVKKVESDTPTEVIKYDDAFTQARTKLKKYNLRDLRKLIKTKEDVDKIVSEIIEITESLNKVQKDIQKDKIKNFLKDNTNVLKFLKSKKEAFGIDLKKTTMNINKLKQNLTSKN
tara:strand:- start:392 stop:1042 length:651 start_codon:yes stop_codon:yes gene_type:complete